MFGLFALGTTAALVVAVVGGFLALRSFALDEAKRDTRDRLLENAKLTESVLQDDLVTADPDAIARVDEVVLTGVLTQSVVRVKLWSADGVVLYSDNPAQIGGRFDLGDEERELLEDGGAEVEETQLNRPENALDPKDGDVIEAYTRIRLPSGQPVLFELYERFDSLNASARRILGAVAWPMLAAIALILLVQAPLVWSLSRRLQRGYEEREGLLAAAVAASNRERRRIASYLHDGPVQEIAGVAFGLAPLAENAAARGDEAEAGELRRAVDGLRQNIRDLRSLLVDLHPPNLAAQGLESAFADLVSPLEARGIDVTVSVEEADLLDPEQRALVFRVAQEAVRNVVAYAGARAVVLTLRREDGRLRLAVTDDGRGFTQETRAARANEGHMGLSLLGELARMSGAVLDVRSEPGAGTTVTLEVPVR
jgi:signal transduction histidine kinase